jgi:hypothetical protein
MKVVQEKLLVAFLFSFFLFINQESVILRICLFYIELVNNGQEMTESRHRSNIGLKNGLCF